MNAESRPEYIYDVCTGDRLKSLIEQGWEFVDAIQERALVTLPTSKSVNKNGGPSYENMHEYGEATGISTVLKFLVRLPRGAVVEDFRKQISEGNERLKKSAADLTYVQGQLDAARAVIEVKDKRLDELRALVGQEKTARQRLEADLGKVREAIGSERFREIVAP